MHLLVFDIDGTIVDSVQADDACFIQTFQELYQIDLSGLDWNSFPHVTDSGLTQEIFQRNFRRNPRTQEIQQIKDHFYALLAKRQDEFQEITGAVNFIQKVELHPDYSLAFATGGWKETASLKMQTIGLDLQDFIHATASDHHDRAEITQLAIQASQEAYGEKDFLSITYIGDGLWDMTTSQKLGINFVGVDFHGKQHLVKAGARKVIKDFGQWDHIPTFAP